MTLALPWLPSLAGRAFADAGPPRRYVQVFSRHGRRWEEWYPPGAGSSLMQVGEHVHARSLVDLPSPLSNILGPAFDPVRGKMSILRGFDGLTHYAEHNLSLPGTASAGPGGNDPPDFAYSVDVVLEESSIVYPSTPLVGALRCGSSSSSYSWLTRDGSKLRLPAVTDPRTLFDTAFGVERPSDPTRERKRLAVDGVLEDYRRVAGDPRLGSADRRRLDNYIDLVHELERRLELEAPSCTPPSLADGSDSSNEVRFSNFFDVVVAALACDVTRVVSMLITSYQDERRNISVEYHAAAHEGRHGHYVRWVMDRVAELVRKMDMVEEPDGSTLLDNSIVYYNSDMAEGNHFHGDLPVIVAGSAGGRLRTGQYIDFRQRPSIDITYNYRTAPAGRPLNQLLVTLLQAMGLGPAEYERLGRRGFGDYAHPRSDVMDAHRIWLDRDPNEPLPYYFLGA